MKNREKFREEIIRSLSGANKDNFDCEICGFIQEHMLPCFGKLYNVEHKCDAVLDCDICGIMFSFWLDEEYEEPEVDWDNVPVDTLVRVRGLKSEEWTLRYFKGIDEEAQESRFMAWGNGTTSKTAYGNYTHWKYCELVEDKDNGSN